RGVFYRGFHEDPRRSAAQWASGKIFRQHEIEAVSAVTIGFAMQFTGAEHGDIHACALYRYFAFHRLAEEVVRPNSPGDVISRAIPVAGLTVVSGEFDRHFELRQDIALHLDRDLRGRPHQRPPM